MAETSLLWPTTGSGDVSPHSVATVSGMFAVISNALSAGANAGVVPGALNELVSTVSGTNILVATGWAIVDGHPYTNTTIKTVTPVIPVVGTTGRRLVLRASWSSVTQTVRITEISSADGTAAIPAMTQTSGTTYDIPLCQYTVAITTGNIAAFVENRVLAEANASVQAMRSLGGGSLVPPSGLGLKGRVTMADFVPTGFSNSQDPTDSYSAWVINGPFQLVFQGQYSSGPPAMASNGNVSNRILTCYGVNNINQWSAFGTNGNSAPGVWGGAGQLNMVVAPNNSPWLRTRFDPLSTSTAANVTTRVTGFVLSVSATANGAYFRRNTTGNLFSVTRQGASETTTDLGAQTAAQRWYDIYSGDAGVTWKFYDHTQSLAATHTTNVPTAGTSLAVEDGLVTADANWHSWQISRMTYSMIDV